MNYFCQWITTFAFRATARPLDFPLRRVLRPGNELSGSGVGVGASISVELYGKDVINRKKIINDLCRVLNRHLLNLRQPLSKYKHSMWLMEGLIGMEGFLDWLQLHRRHTNLYILILVVTLGHECMT
ncbi:uncharacterized protein [Euphorbia lathyris]|uniref:uncharacterized protein n=1 Tax=Euphorbia lathyris TaxID=212925 RepID=UPI003313F550